VSRPIPSQFNPVPSLPQSCPRSHGGSVIQSRPNISSPVPIAVPFNRKCPDRTFVRRKSLPGQDYGRTPSSGPDSPCPDRLRVPTVPHSCPVPDLGLWTLDLGYLKFRPRPVRPVPINPVPIRSHPGRIRPLIARTAHRSRLPNVTLEPLSLGYPFFARVMFQPSPSRGVTNQWAAWLARCHRQSGLQPVVTNRAPRPSLWTDQIAKPCSLSFAIFSRSSPLGR
jgi:hypothetical protein